MKDKYFQRELMRQIKKWIDRREIYAIKGPRQSGKTTLLIMLRDWLIEEKKVNPKNIIFITFEDRENLEKFAAAPKEFIKSFISDENQRYYFLLDEFQYVNNGGKELKLLYDEFENIKFVITGSSSLELTSKTSKYLVGRMFSFYLYPFSFEESVKAIDERLARLYKERNDIVKDFIQSGKEFKIKEDIFLKDFEKIFNEYVIFGGYPEVLKTDDIETKKVIIKNIYETYITREIIELLKVHDIFKFRKLVSVLSSQLGGMAKYNELASSCDTYYKELIKMLEILEETFIIKTIKPFHRNIKTELRKNPKIYFIDLGLRNYAINNFNPLKNRVDKGEIVENFVLSHLLIRDIGKLNYWRTLGKAEMDFVLTIGDEMIPIEVKYMKFKKTKLSKSFKSFISAYNPKRALVLTKDFWGKIKFNKTTVAFIPVCYI